MFTNLDNALRDVNGPIVLVADPDDTVTTEGTNTHTQDTTEDGVSGGDGHTKPGGHSQVQGGGNDGAGHSEHEQRRGFFEGGDIDNLSPDGVGDTATNTHSAYKFQDDGTAHGLDVGEGAGRDG